MSLSKKTQVFLLLSALVLITIPSCGRKKPPFIPKEEITLRVKALTNIRENGEVILQGRFVDLKGRPVSKKDISDIKGCEVYYAQYPIEDPPCEGCPVRFNNSREIKGNVMFKGNFYVKFSGIKQRGIYFFKVCLIDRNKAVGPPSNKTKLVLEVPAQ